MNSCVFECSVITTGGIETLLELVYIWQLLQVGMTSDRPVILFVKEIWSGLLKWMHDVLLAHGYVSIVDFRWITLVDTEQEVFALLLGAHQRYLEARTNESEGETDRSITAKVLGQAAFPTELTEEGTT